MKTAIFLQSDEPDPFAFYNGQLLNGPVYRDEEKNITAVYSYAGCLAVLNNPAACVPPQNNTGLNEQALSIAGKLARFRNTSLHSIAKRAAIELHQQLQPVPVNELLAELLNQPPGGQEIDWVKQVSRRLPVLTILKGFDFSDEDCEYLSSTISSLVKIMQPNKTNEMTENINRVSASCYQVIERHILKTKSLYTIVTALGAEFSCSSEDALAICVANLAGLMTQSYDACSGLLSNTLRYALTKGQQHKLPEFITEILRYDPPVHNTRRVATESIIVNGHEIKKGENILLVLAAANRDEKQFKQANIFDPYRSNNNSQLTFGAGMHACVASQFATNMAAQVLESFFELFPNAQLLTDHIEYEPIINARLPVSLLISLL